MVGGYELIPRFGCNVSAPRRNDREESPSRARMPLVVLAFSRVSHPAGRGGAGMSARTTYGSGERGHANLSAADLDDAFEIPGGGLAQEAEDDAGQQSFEAAQCFESGLAFGLAAFEVGARAWVPAALDDGQLVQCGVELPVSVAVEAVASLLAGGGIERCDAGEARELRVGAKSSDPAGLADELSGDQSSAALQLEELGA